MKRLDMLISEMGNVITGTSLVLLTVNNPILRDYAEQVNETHRQWLAELRGISADLNREVPHET